MVEEWIHALAANAWALPTLFGLVLADSFLVVVPGELAVTALGSLSWQVGPPLWAVILTAALAAAAGDAACYAIGRALHPERWRIAARSERFARAHGWARRRLRDHVALAVFTARFIPFARLVVNLTAGSARVPASRYLPIAAGSATLWAAYQALIGAAVSAVVPGGTITAVLVSIAVALLLGWAVDALLARFARGASGEQRL